MYNMLGEKNKIKSMPRVFKKLYIATSYNRWPFPGYKKSTLNNKKQIKNMYKKITWHFKYPRHTFRFHFFFFRYIIHFCIYIRVLQFFKQFIIIIFMFSYWLIIFIYINIVMHLLTLFIVVCNLISDLMDVRPVRARIIIYHTIW